MAPPDSPGPGSVWVGRGDINDELVVSFQTRFLIALCMIRTSAMPSYYYAHMFSPQLANWREQKGVACKLLTTSYPGILYHYPAPD